MDNYIELLQENYIDEDTGDTYEFKLFYKDELLVNIFMVKISFQEMKVQVEQITKQQKEDICFCLESD